MRRTWTWPHELRFEGATVHYGFGGVRPAAVGVALLGLILGSVAVALSVFLFTILRGSNLLPPPKGRDLVETLLLFAAAIAWCVGIFALLGWLLTPRRVRSCANAAELRVERWRWGIPQPTVVVPAPYSLIAQQHVFRGARWIRLWVVDKRDRRRMILALRVDTFRAKSGRRVIRSTARLLLADPIVVWRTRTKPFGEQNIVTGEFRSSR
jgi:hypothetical protein